MHFSVGGGRRLAAWQLPNSAKQEQLNKEKGR
jgi:hypothetical protein